ncbi:hypothetical protein AVEN_25771-1 [Araneus ventricosus]|uniref:Uncharacterized protein n=1 Tax=Araneus ventricosus TaxID=182803 RepID=A0A4Y2R2C4_ARAVE|nr:hypothetical protein AVEN_25771-1 [Araneus ventricosus]
MSRSAGSGLAGLYDAIIKFNSIIVQRKRITIRKSQDAAENRLTSYPRKSRDKQSEVGLLFHFENSVINENDKKVIKNAKGRRKINQEIRGTDQSCREFCPSYGSEINAMIDVKWEKSSPFSG